MFRPCFGSPVAQLQRAEEDKKKKKEGKKSGNWENIYEVSYQCLKRKRKRRERKNRLRELGHAKLVLPSDGWLSLFSINSPDKTNFFIFLRYLLDHFV